MTESRTFPGATTAVSQARRFVRENLAEADEEIVEQVVMMVSELATNSVRHARTSFTVSVDCEPDAISVEVTDGGSGVPEVHTPRPDEPSGRGLLIVQSLADEWGVRDPADVTRSAALTEGKTVWFVVRVPPTPMDGTAPAGAAELSRRLGRGGAEPMRRRLGMSYET